MSRSEQTEVAGQAHPEQKTAGRAGKASRVLLVLVLLAAAGGAAWTHFGRGGASELVLYGNVDQRQIELAFMDSERIAEVLVQEGDIVAPGQLLARQETRRLQDRIAVAEGQTAACEAALLRLRNGTRPEEIDQARAAAASARAELNYAEADLRRYRGIWKESRGQAVSRQDMEQSQLKRDVAKAQLTEQEKALRLAEIGPRDEDIAEAEANLREARASLDQLRNLLADAELRSPARSVVFRRLLEPGDMGTAGRTVFSLAVLEPKWVRAYVSETEMGHVATGMRALIETDSNPGRSVEGTVGFVSSVAEFTPKTVETTELRTSLVYEVRVYTNDADNILRLGMPATVRFPDAGARE
ncbi:MAG: HlyD family efflux transporter periplasmic adaptor subunit [Desulfovibrionaceae bacterium]|nr:HlyD family efflux transporter periplasmic adaptor subunit [Desulfovibrionaceae bacterium]